MNETFAEFLARNNAEMACWPKWKQDAFRVNLEQFNKQMVRTCPFCRGVARGPIRRYDGTWYLQCTTCKADGPPAMTEDQARDLWNTRP